MSGFIKANALVIIGVLAGAIGGFFYWHNVGCSSGTCMITSHPVNSTIYGAVMGGLVFSFFKPSKKTKA